MTETQTVDITLVDQGNYESTFKIDNPKSSITMAAIRAAFQPMITAGYLYSRYNNAQASVIKAQKVVTQKTDIE